MEVCVDSVQSAIEAQKGGACRIELCSGLPVGGLTPSSGLVKAVKEMLTIPVYVLIRPRQGDFLYTDDEKAVIRNDVDGLIESGADGLVVGALTSDGEIDVKLCREIIELSDGRPITFHRAFDMTSNAESSLERLIELNVTRVLTSGRKKSAIDGVDLLAKLHEQAAGRIVIMPGGGITEDNLPDILNVAGVREFHTSASKRFASEMKYKNLEMSVGSDGQDFEWKVCCANKVSNMLNIANDIWSSNQLSG
ncbi:CUTC (predicted) [Pycnogonum litorale]